MIHFVFLPCNTDWGGSELLWSRTIMYLSKKDIKVSVVLHPKLKLPKDLEVFIKNNNVEKHLYAIDQIKFPKRILNRFLPYRLQFKSHSSKFNIVKKLNPDLIVLNQGFNNNAVMDLSHLLKLNIPYVTISHAVNEGLWPELNLRTGMRKLFLNSKMNYFVSKDNFKVTELQIGEPLKNFKIVRNPFQLFNPKDIQETNSYELAFVGRYHFSSKGQDSLLRVLNNDKWKSRNLIINFYGEGEDLENLKSIVKNFKISNVKIHKYTSIDDVWLKNSGLILTSRYEGLPITIVEAMFAKRFVIVTNVSGNVELLIDNVDSFIIEAPRPVYIDNALERAWERRSDWKKIGETAYRNIIKEIPEKPEKDFSDELLNLIK